MAARAADDDYSLDDDSDAFRAGGRQLFEQANDQRGAPFVRFM